MRTRKVSRVNIQPGSHLVTFLALLVVTLGSAWPQDLPSRPQGSVRHEQSLASARHFDVYARTGLRDGTSSARWSAQSSMSGRAGNAKRSRCCSRT